MASVQFYETEVVHKETRLAAHFIVLPGKFLRGETITVHPGSTILDFGQLIGVIPTPDYLATAVGLTITATSVEDFRHQYEEAQAKGFEVPPPLELFMQSLAYDRLIPIEQSPLEKVSLASAVVSGANQLGPNSLGAVAAVVAFGDNPIVIVAVPLGIILVGAAKGIASALEEGLRAKILDKLGVEREKTPVG